MCFLTTMQLRCQQLLPPKILSKTKSSLILRAQPPNLRLKGRQTRTRMLDVKARGVRISMRKREPINRFRMHNPHLISQRPHLHTERWTNQNVRYNSTWSLNYTHSSTIAKSGTFQSCRGWLPYVDVSLDWFQTWIQLLIQRAQTG